MSLLELSTNVLRSARMGRYVWSVINQEDTELQKKLGEVTAYDNRLTALVILITKLFHLPRFIAVC